MKKISLLSSLLCGSIILACSLPAHAAVAAPNVTGMRVFEAVPPYQVETRDGRWTVPLYVYGDPNKVDRRRGFDFVTPLIDPIRGHMNAMSLQAPYSGFLSINDKHMDGVENIWKTGSPGRIEYKEMGGEKRLLIAYRPNDKEGPDKKLRVMVNSWPLPQYTTLYVDLSFKLGGESPGEEWPVEPGSPKLLWQIKSDNPDASGNSFPSMGFYVIEDNNPNLVALRFFLRKQNQFEPSLHWEVHGLPRGQFNDVIVKLNLNDKENGKGILHVWVNGQEAAYHEGRNLTQLPKPAERPGDPAKVEQLNRMAFGAYLMSHEAPTPKTFVTQWRRARVLVP